MATYTDYKTVDTTVTDITALNQAIRNILITPLGSLPGRPDFGSKLHTLLFSNIQGNVSNEVLSDIVKPPLMKWEPRINVLSVSSDYMQSYNTMNIIINFSFSNNGTLSKESLSIAYAL